MKRIPVSIVIVVALAAPAAVSAADADWAVVPALDFGFKRSDINLSVNGNAKDVGRPPRYTAIIPSLALSYSRFYGLLSFDVPLSQYHDAQGGNTSSPFWRQVDYERRESAFTLGYRALPSLSVFAGLLRSETDLRLAEYSWDAATQTWTPASFTDMKLDEDGYHVGVSYTHTFGDKGSFSASIARGRMDGTFSTTDGATAEGTASARATGNSFSAGWTGPLTGSLSYRVGLRYVKYVYEFQTQVGIRIEEPVTSFTIGLSNYF